jgi:hypothetical protein
MLLMSSHVSGAKHYQAYYDECLENGGVGSSSVIALDKW